MQKLPELDIELVRKLGRPLFLASMYHRHEVHGLENIPKTGRSLMLVNHSFATYDICLLVYQIFLQIGRAPYSLGDSKLFAVKKVADFFQRLHAIEGSHEAGESVLERDEMLIIAPGGMREALRPSSEARQINWQKRRGFVRLSIKTQSPVLLAACPNADQIFNIYPSFLTKFLYKSLKIPFVIGRGIGPTAIPRPTKLDHHISSPILPPKISTDDPEFEKEVDSFHALLIGKMEELMSQS